ncbi:MAG TPA: fumarate hydratase, partial [Rhodospirillum rubrum]|nr:fumarate hydratase [Rhodospirillum rubrum]
MTDVSGDTRIMIDRAFADVFPLAEDKTLYRALEGTEGLVSVERFRGEEMLVVAPEALTRLAQEAFRDIAH